MFRQDSFLGGYLCVQSWANVPNRRPSTLPCCMLRAYCALFVSFLLLCCCCVVILFCFVQLLKETGILSSVVYGAMDQEARSIHLDKFRKGKVLIFVFCFWSLVCTIPYNNKGLPVRLFCTPRVLSTHTHILVATNHKNKCCSTTKFLLDSHIRQSHVLEGRIRN